MKFTSYIKWVSYKCTVFPHLVYASAGFLRTRLYPLKYLEEIQTSMGWPSAIIGEVVVAESSMPAKTTMLLTGIAALTYSRLHSHYTDEKWGYVSQ